MQVGSSLSKLSYIITQDSHLSNLCYNSINCPRGSFNFMAIRLEKEHNQEIDLRQRPLVFVDIETTGLDPNTHEIIEIACLVVDPQTLEVKKEYHSKVQPKHLETADPIALEKNKFSPEAWVSAKPLRQVLDELNTLAPSGMPVGYNVSFDRKFIEEAFQKERVVSNFDYHWIDIMSLVYWKLLSDRRLKRLKLIHVCKVLDVSLEEAHTAMGDIRATLAVYRYLKEEITSESLVD